MKRYTILLMICWLAGCSHHSAGPASADGLEARIVERLAVMKPVAFYKYRHGLPVEAPEREASLLAEVETAGTSRELPPEITRRFFRAQIEAAKMVQEERLRAWSTRRQAPPLQVPDLVNELRPQLDQLSETMLRDLAVEWKAARDPGYSESGRRAAIEEAVRTAGYSDAVATAASAGIRGITTK